jgi:hypothetical protein
MQMFIISALTGDIVFREREWVSYSQGQKRGAGFSYSSFDVRWGDKEGVRGGLKRGARF